MSRIAISLLILSLGAVSATPFGATIGGGWDNWFAALEIPFLPPINIKGVTFEIKQNLSTIFFDPVINYSFNTTEKYLELVTNHSDLQIAEYVSSGQVLGMDVSGDGTVHGILGGGTHNRISYTSKSADSFCVVPGSVKVNFDTVTASLVMTGMKNKALQTLIDNFIHTNEAKLGKLASVFINKEWGPAINKYVSNVMNSICGEIPPSAAN